MKRLMMGLMLLLVAGAASAEWSIAGENDESVSYADRATIHRSGNFVKMWNLRDFKTVRESSAGMSYSSVKGQDEYDCKGKKDRGLAVTLYSRRMGNGKVVALNFDAGEWRPVVVGSAGEAVWEIACGKK